MNHYEWNSYIPSWDLKTILATNWKKNGTWIPENRLLRNIIKQVSKRQDTEMNADEKIEEKEEEQ